MFVSQNATFAGSTLPLSGGAIKGLAGIYGANAQLLPINLNDLAGLNTARFTSLHPLSFETPTFEGVMIAGTAISGGKITIPYTNGKGNTYMAGIAVSGTGAAGINDISSQSVTLAYGSGTIELDITGTPSTAGAVTFTISGITELSTTTVNATVNPSGSKVEQVVYSTGFEDSESFTASTIYNKKVEVAFGNAGSQWNTSFGTVATVGAISESQSMQMRWYTTTPTDFGYTYTAFDLTDVTKVVFSAANTSGINVNVSYSDDNGVTWKGTQLFTLSTSKAEHTYNINSVGVASARIKFEIALPSPSPTGTSRLYIDDVQVYGLR